MRDCWLLEGAENMSKNTLPASQGLALQGEHLSLKYRRGRCCLQSDQESPTLSPVCNKQGHGPWSREARSHPASPPPSQAVLQSFAWLTWVPVGPREREGGGEHGGGWLTLLGAWKGHTGPLMSG